MNLFRLTIDHYIVNTIISFEYLIVGISIHEHIYGIVHLKVILAWTGT